MPAGSVELLPKRMTTSMCRPSPLTAGMTRSECLHVGLVVGIRLAPQVGGDLSCERRAGRSTLHISRCQAARF
jgi:hypothetical protein